MPKPNWEIPEYYGNMFPDHKENTLLKIKFTAYKLDKIGAWIHSKSTYQRSDAGLSWTFLAPNEINEDVVHTWDEFESIGTRAAQKYVDVSHARAEIDTIGEKGSDLFKALEKNDKKISTTINEVSKAGNVGSVPMMKVDTALVYKNSNRRTYSLEWDIHFWNDGKAETEIFEPIRELTKASCAAMDTSGPTKIDFPYIFTVKTIPNSNLININNAVITSVQPVWVYPFIDGYPSRCRLTISFTDLEPLYKASWDQAIG